jgi:hypothetical protein
VSGGCGISLSEIALFLINGRSRLKPLPACGYQIHTSFSLKVAPNLI